MAIASAPRGSSARGIEHPLFARLFDRASRRLEGRGQREYRRTLLDGLAGRVIEVGAGNGLNFAHYPPSVTEVVAVEPEPFLRERALEAARAAPVEVTVLAGVAEALPAKTASFDAGVVSLVLCTVSDQATALAELRRVICPGGELRFYEHVRAERPLLARAQQAFDVVWPRLAGGCHTSRDTRSAIERAGFVIESCDAFLFRPFPLALPTAPHILGAARRPPTDGRARTPSDSERDDERRDAADVTHCVHDALASGEAKTATEKSEELLAAVERFTKTR